MKRIRFKTSIKDQQTGFTIVELLIATTVFSMVLMVVLYGVLSFSRAYFGGVNASTTQDTARNVVNTISQSIEFSGNVIAQTTPISLGSDTYTFCAGGEQYYFTLGLRYDGTSPLSSSNPGLYMEPTTCGTATNFSNPKGKELLGNAMRVTYLMVQPSSNPRLYTVQLGLAYGDSDLLCNQSNNGHPYGCYPGDALYGGAPTTKVKGSSPNDVVCKQVTGSQFCAHAGLSTTVSLRVGNSSLAP